MKEQRAKLTDTLKPVNTEKPTGKLKETSGRLPAHE
jgi:hypothetical protein